MNKFLTMNTPPNTPRRRKGSVSQQPPSKRRNSRQSDGSTRKSLPMKRKLTVYKKKKYAMKKKAKRSRKGGKKSYKKKSMSRLEQKTLYMSKGYVSQEELIRTVSDPNALYIGHSTWAPDLISVVIAKTIIRKLLNKLGVYPSKTSDNLNLSAGIATGTLGSTGTIGSNSVGYCFRYIWEDVDSVQNFKDHITPAGASIDTISSAWGLSQFIFQAMVNQSTDVVLKEAQILQLEGTGLQPRIRGTIYFDTEKLDLYVDSCIVLQNRTKGASLIADNDQTAIDNQALKGYMYEFKGGVPNGRAGRRSELSQVNNDGVLVRAATSPAGFGIANYEVLGTEYREPPVPKTFANCVKSKAIISQSGEYYKMQMRSKWSGSFNYLIYKKLYFKAEIATGVRTVQLYVPGKCQMVALEEVLNSGSSNFITIAFEVQREVGAMLRTTKRTVLLGQHFEGVALPSG